MASTLCEPKYRPSQVKVGRSAASLCGWCWASTHWVLNSKHSIFDAAWLPLAKALPKTDPLASRSPSAAREELPEMLNHHISRCEHPKLAHNQTLEYITVAISNHPNLNFKIHPKHSSDFSKYPIAQNDWSPTQLHPTHPLRWMTHSQHIGHHWSIEPTSPDVKLRLGLSSCCMSDVGFLENEYQQGVSSSKPVNPLVNDNDNRISHTWLRV